jgi:hypothetical protein
VVEEDGAAATLLRAARSFDTDLLVVGRQAIQSFPGLTMGSVAHRSVGFAPRATVVAPLDG